MKRPAGIWGAVVLPVNEKGNIDWALLSDELDVLIATGLNGLYTNGTAGEFHQQTEQEYERLTSLVIEKCNKAKVPFQIGVSHSNPRIARDRLARLPSCGAMAAQLILPDWWKPSDPEVNRFMEGMQTAAQDLPLILYNPPHAKRQLTLEDIAALRNIAPNLIGAKLPGGDEAWYAKRRRILPDFSVFVAGHTVAFGRPLGADGAYSNVACLSPKGALLHWQLSETDPEKANDLEHRIQKFMNSYIVPLVSTHGLSNAALDKMMVEVGGWGPVKARMLWPSESAPKGAIAEAKSAIKGLLPEFIFE